MLYGGKTDECDLLITADASRSKARAALKPDVLEFQKVVAIMGNSRFVGEVLPPANKEGMRISALWHWH